MNARLSVAASTAHMGFYATATAMVACLTHQSLSAGRAYFPMNTATTSAPVLTGMFARKVAQVTGLSARELENLHPDRFGSPGHWKFVSGEGGGMFYTPQGLLAVLEALRLAERKAEALCLGEAIRAGGLEVKAPTAAPITQLPDVSYAPPPVSRLTQWERDHEE